MGTFTLTQVHFLRKKTVLLLRYCGRRSSRYFILMQYKLKMLQFIPNAPSTFLWAMRPIREWFILLSKLCSKPWSNQLANQWIGSWISLNDSFSSLPHALSHLKQFSLRVVTESLRTSRALSAAARNLFQKECLCLDTINIDIFPIFTLAEI